MSRAGQKTSINPNTRPTCIFCQQCIDFESSMCGSRISWLNSKTNRTVYCHSPCAYFALIKGNDCIVNSTTQPTEVYALLRDAHTWYSDLKNSTQCKICKKLNAFIKCSKCKKLCCHLPCVGRGIIDTPNVVFEVDLMMTRGQDTLKYGGLYMCRNHPPMKELLEDAEFSKFDFSAPVMNVKSLTLSLQCKISTIYEVLIFDLAENSGESLK